MPVGATAKVLRRPPPRVRLRRTEYQPSSRSETNRRPSDTRQSTFGTQGSPVRQGSILGSSNTTLVIPWQEEKALERFPLCGRQRRRKYRTPYQKRTGGRPSKSRAHLAPKDLPRPTRVPPGFFEYDLDDTKPRSAARATHSQAARPRIRHAKQVPRPARVQSGREPCRTPLEFHDPPLPMMNLWNELPQIRFETKRIFDTTWTNAFTPTSKKKKGQERRLTALPRRRE